MSADASLVDRHLRVGFWGLAASVALGLGLEALHAAKVAFFLDAGQETVRLLLRLAHAHGAGLSLVNVAYAAAAHVRPATGSRRASTCLLAATALVPLGFLAGTIGARGGDPGLGVALVPPGGVLLLVGLVTVATRASRYRD